MELRIMGCFFFFSSPLAFLTCFLSKTWAKREGGGCQRVSSSCLYMVHVLQAHVNEDNSFISPFGFNISAYHTLQILWVAFHFPQLLLVKYWKATGKEVAAILSNVIFKWSHKQRLSYCSQTNFEILVVHLSFYSGWFVWSRNSNSDFTRLLETPGSPECGPWTISIEDTS